MNYKSQLKGWAVDRVIEYWKVAGPYEGQPVPDRSLSNLMKEADDLAAYAYVAREDLQSTAKDLLELVREAAPGEASIDQIIAALDNVRNERVSQGIDKIDEQTAVGGAA